MEPTLSSPTPLSRALETIKRLKAQLDSQGTTQPIAVVGVGLRFPGAIDNLDAYWQALAEGRDLVQVMPAARKRPFAAEWDALPHKGGFLDDVMGFDAAFFGISPREARALDPQHRLLLEVAWEALENAALPPERLKGTRTGLYVGITGQDYRDWLTDAPDAYWATGNGHCFASGRIAYAMGFTGPAITVDTACSSGLVAVHLAAQALRRGECEVAVAGGVNLILSPRSTRLVRETRALAPDGLCKAFDARANGFTRGEGCGVVILKRLDHALRDRDHIHAVIRGSAVNQDGRSSGFTAPNVRAQITLIETALADAGLSPADIGYVEAHGTGTSLGDPIEMEALVEALGRKNAGARLHVGSVKTNLGHLEAAAGVAGLIKAIACCNHQAIPALVHYTTLNPRIDLAGTGIALPTALVPWAPGDGAGRFAAVSSFGLSGTNAHMIVGAAEPTADAPPAHAVAGFELTARTPAALRELAARFRSALGALPSPLYDAFAYSATFGRSRHGVRARIAAHDKAAAMAALDAIARGAPSPAVTLGAGDAIHDDLPRHVVPLPHYPWERERHAPNVEVRDARDASPPPEPPAALLALPALAPARRDAVHHQVHRQVATILGHGGTASINPTASFFDYGLDSLMAVDLARGLAAAFGIELAFIQIFENATVDALTAAIVARLPAAVEPAPLVVVTEASARRRPSSPRAPRVGFLFSCQGSQYFGMGHELYASEPVFRARIDTADRVLAPLLGTSLIEVMMRSRDELALHETRVTQPALVAFEVALADLWNARGIHASVVMGHSLGEVAAAIHAGVMDFESGLELTAHRARLMQAMAPGAMLAVRASPARVAGWIDGTDLDIAAFNGPDATVVSGDRDAVDALAVRVKAEGIAARLIGVTLASHSRLMDPLLRPFHDAISHIVFQPPRLPLIANLTGRPAAAGEHDASYWCRHVREPVRFHQSVQALRGFDLDACLEIGPDRNLISLVNAGQLLPAGRGVASLRRDGGEIASLEDAARLLDERAQLSVSSLSTSSLSASSLSTSSLSTSSLSASRLRNRPRPAIGSHHREDRRVA